MIISNEKIRRLYAVCEKEGRFRRREANEAVNSFVEKYFHSDGYSEETDKFIGELFDIIEEERKNAFALGCVSVAQLV